MGNRAKYVLPKYVLLGVVLTATSIVWAGKKPADAPKPTAASSGFDRVVDQMIVREAENNKALRRYSPLVETYLQSMRPDPEVGMVPVADQYYLHRVGFKKALEETNFHADPGFLSRALHGAGKNYHTEFVSSGFN